MLVVGCMLAVGAGEASAAPLTTLRVSVPATGGQANGDSTSAVVSADGTTVAFDSTATNLSLRADTNHARDVFVRNLATGRTRRVSVSSHEQQAAGTSHVIAISRDGRRVLFDSTAPTSSPAIRTASATSSSATSCRERHARSTRLRGAARASAGAVRPSARPQRERPLGLFATGAPNLVPAGSSIGIFLRDLKTHVTRTVALSDNFVARVAGQVSFDGNRIAYSICGIGSGDFPGESFILQRHPHTRTPIGASLGDGSTVVDLAEGGRLVLLTVFSLGTSGAEVFSSTARRTPARADVSGGTIHNACDRAGMSGDGRFATFLRLTRVSSPATPTPLRRLPPRPGRRHHGHQRVGGGRAARSQLVWRGDDRRRRRRVLGRDGVTRASQLSQRRVPPRPVP